MNDTATAIPDFDPFALETPGKNPQFITSIPGPDRPLICKIIPDATYGNGKSWYRPIRHFPYLCGPNPETDTRNKVCTSFFGEKSPENDAYWEYKKALSSLKKLGKGDSVEGRKLEAMVKKFQPRDGGWLLVIEPESPLVKAVRVPISVLHILMGKEETSTKPAIPSLIKQMAADGVSPFDTRYQKPKVGWIKIYKTGEKMATRYFVEPAKVDVIVEHNGKKMKALDYQEFTPHQKVLNNELTLADLPNVIEYESKYRWTLEECEEYAKSFGVNVPERFLKKARQSGRVDETDEAGPSASLSEIPDFSSIPGPSNEATAGNEVTQVVGLDDIPF